MKKFRKRCDDLRDFYLMMETTNTKVILLSKLVALSFYNEYQLLDELPKRKTLEIDCSDLSEQMSLSEIENSLSKVLSDLEFKDYDILHNASMRGIAIQSAGGFINISGLDNNEKVSFYGIDGKMLGSATAINGTTSFAAQSGSIVVAKIGKEIVKIAVK